MSNSDAFQMGSDRELLQRARIALEVEAKGYRDRHERLMPLAREIADQLAKPDPYFEALRRVRLHALQACAQPSFAKDHCREILDIVEGALR